MQLLSDISAQLQAGKAKMVKELVQKAIDEGISAELILNEGLLNGMGIIGNKFKNNEVYVPDVLIAARAMNAGTELLRPLLVAADIKPKGKVVIGTVAGDLHDIGKNLVRMMMEGNGLQVIDLGVDVSAKKFVETAIAENANIIACSALLTTTMTEMAAVVEELERAGARDRIKVMVGGAPVTDSFCEKIRADRYTPDAATAAEVAAAFCEGK